MPDLAELQRSVSQRTLLPNEDPESPYVEDAVHWIRVYSELIGVKESLLERAEQAEHNLTDDAIADLKVDRRLLGAQLERYKRRHEYWLNRVTELAGTQRAQSDGGDPTGGGTTSAVDEQEPPAEPTEHTDG